VTVLIHGAKICPHAAMLPGYDRQSGRDLFSLPRMFLLLANQLV
jgi:hypothetical protein